MYSNPVIAGVTNLPKAPMIIGAAGPLEAGSKEGTKQPVPPELVDETVADVNTMGALFPMQFEDRYRGKEEPAVFINMRDPEDEPNQPTGSLRG